MLSLPRSTVSLLLIFSSTSILSPRSAFLALYQLSFPLSKVKFPTVFPGHHLHNSQVLQLFPLANMRGELLFMVIFSGSKQLNEYTNAHRERRANGRKDSHSLCQLHVSSPDLVVALAVKAEYLLNPQLPSYLHRLVLVHAVIHYI